MCIKILANCLSCGKEMLLLPCHKGVRKYCNRSCYDSYRAEIWKSKGFTCKYCGKRVEKPSNQNSSGFCSAKCRSSSFRSDKDINCRACGAHFTAIKYTKNGGFVVDKDRTSCTKECRTYIIKNDTERKRKISEAFTGSNHPLWTGGGKGNGYRGANWIRLAEDCREKQNRLCCICSKSEKENGRKLDVDHIIPFHQSKNKEIANKQSNLQAMCKSCHRKKDAKWKRDNPVQKTIPFC